jgi:signal transduction histidine kinase
MSSVREQALSREKVALLEERLRAVTEIAYTLGSPMDLDTLLHAVMERVTRLVGADRSTFFVVDHEQHEVWSRVLQRDTDPPERQAVPPEIRLPFGKGFAGWVASEGQPAIVADAYQDARFDPSWDQVTGYVTGALMALPVWDRDRRVAAVVQCLNKPGGFTDEDRDLLASVTGQIGVALENAFLYEELLRRNRDLQQARDRLRRANAELGLLYDLERHLARAKDEDALVRTALWRICDHLDADACALVLDGGSRARLAGWIRTQGVRIEEPLSEADARSLVVRLAKPQRLEGDEITVEIALLGDRLPHEVLVSAPLALDDNPMGALQVVNPRREPEPFGGHLTLAVLLGAHIARSLQLQRSRATKEQAQRLSLVGQAVSAILHDLRTPMGAVQGYVELMTEADDAAERARLATRVQRGLHHMETMTREVLEFARGEKELLVSGVNVNEFIEEAREILEPSFARAGLNLVIDARYAGVARFDRGKLLRVVANLARNAREAMDRGGTFTWILDRDGQDLVMDFADTGRGIPADRREHLFEFFASWGKRDGSGLGLAMAHRFVEAHGGSIACLASGARGTTFQIRLPLNGPPR